MSSILNSISTVGNQVLLMPSTTSVKEDSIIELLHNSEIEFNTCHRPKNKLDSFNTGFGSNNDLYYETPCVTLQTPLYKDKYLSEFVTEEEKASARHALGIYNKEDVVAMSLLTAENQLPTQQDLAKASVKQLRQGDQFFTPITSFTAVYDSSGITLSTRLQEIQAVITQQQKDLLKITQQSTSETITSLGDITAFLQGFHNGDNLRKTIDDMNQEMVRFEVTGQIIN